MCADISNQRIGRKSKVQESMGLWISTAALVATKDWTKMPEKMKKYAFTYLVTSESAAIQILRESMNNGGDFPEDFAAQVSAIADADENVVKLRTFKNDKVLGKIAVEAK